MLIWFISSGCYFMLWVLLSVCMNDFYYESETVELKRSTAQIEMALKAFCAFLNHKVIYFSVSDIGIRCCIDSFGNSC